MMPESLPFAAPVVPPPRDPAAAAVSIRPVRRGDLDAVIEIDAMVTGIEKRDYWNSLYRRYADAVATGQHFLFGRQGCGDECGPLFG